MAEQMNLGGAWRMREADSQTWHSAHVPGSVYADLMADGTMPDPFWRENELDAFERMKKDYVYQRAFTVTEAQLAHAHVELVCEGLDTLAHVSLNGREIAFADNMHITWVWDVKEQLHAGENTLEIRFDSPILYCAKKAEEAPGWESSDATPGFRHLRKAHCMFGWDWGPRLPDDRNIFSRVMERHQRNQAANGKILSYLSQTFRYPNSFDDLLYASQLRQAEAIRYGVEHWRRNRGRCMGAIIWQLNDIWPVASWASIDYYGRWKALHYAAKRFFAPVMISAEEEGELSQNPKINECHPAPLEKSFRLNVCNETLRDVTGKVVWALRTPDGEIVRQNQQTLTIPAMSAKWLDKVDCADASLTGHYVSFAFVVDDVALSEGTCIFCAPKHFEFVDPRLTVETCGDTLVVTSHAYAKQVWLESEDADLLLDDNAFDMNPGTEVVRVVKGTAEKVRVRSVWDLGR